MLDKTSSIYQSKKGQHSPRGFLLAAPQIKNSQPIDEPAISRPIPDAWIFQVIFGRIFLIKWTGLCQAMSFRMKCNAKRVTPFKSFKTFKVQGQTRRP